MVSLHRRRHRSVMLKSESPTSIIYFVRHGQTDFNRAGISQGQLDIPLNDCGEQQAKLCGKRFKDVKLDFILSSDLQRAYNVRLLWSYEISLYVTNLQACRLQSVYKRTTRTLKSSETKLSVKS